MEPVDNAAYDLSNFDKKTAEETEKDIKVRTLRVIKNKRRVRAVAPYKIILAVAAVLAVTTLMIYNRVTIMELNAEINDYKSRIVALDSEYVRLSAQIEAGGSMKSLEQSAADSLGLTKIDASQVEYVNLAGADKIEVARVGGGFTMAKWWEEFISFLEEYIGS